jgi:hypothetical protein
VSVCNAHYIAQKAVKDITIDDEQALFLYEQSELPYLGVLPNFVTDKAIMYILIIISIFSQIFFVY